VSRALKAGRKYRISAGVSIRNILDHANPGLIVSNIASPLFGQANQMYGQNGEGLPRTHCNLRIELQVRFAFSQ
jgi:hypothetical protein